MLERGILCRFNLNRAGAVRNFNIIGHRTLKRAKATRCGLRL